MKHETRGGSPSSLSRERWSAYRDIFAEVLGEVVPVVGGLFSRRVDGSVAEVFEAVPSAEELVEDVEQLGVGDLGARSGAPLDAGRLHGVSFSERLCWFCALQEREREREQR